MNQFELLIDNKPRPASSGNYFVRNSPFDGKPTSRAASATVKDAKEAVDSCSRAFKKWSKTDHHTRRAILNRVADLFEERADSFMDIMVQETGAAPSWGRFNAMIAAGTFREAAAITSQIKGEILPTKHKGYLSMVHRTPKGVCLAIAPWNAPLILCARAIAMPLACGNTVLLKTSEVSPGTQVMLAQLLHEAGLPEGVLNVLTVAPEDNPKVVEAIIAHPATRHVNFTGSSKVGSIIGEMCGRHLKQVLLELGGKAPFIVLNDANVDAAVDAAVFGAFMHQGQICMSTEKLIVQEGVADEFAKKLAARAAALKTGDPRDGSKVELAACFDERSSQRVKMFIEDALAKGATLLAGGKVNGVYIEATVLDNVTPDMQVYKEESFGPLAPIVRVADADEAVKLANDTEYGLAATVFTENVTAALEMSERMESGAIHINGPTVQDEAHVPLGGVKDSGYGRFQGIDGILEFTDARWVTIDSHDTHHYPF